MKKIKILIIMLLCIMPLGVKAKEYCKVISGNGKNLGSEIACGTEHFYVLENKDGKIRAFAKYNLYAGVIIHREKIEKDEGDTRSDETYCSELAASKNATVKSDEFYSSPGYCYYMTYISEDETYQKENAVSAHWDEEGNYLYPQVGDIYIPIDSHQGLAAPLEVGYTFHSEPVVEGTNFYDFDIDVDINEDPNINNFNQTYVLRSRLTEGLGRPMLRYKNNLKSMGFSVEDISLLSLSELNNLSKKISNKNLPIKEWGENVVVKNSSSSSYPIELHFGDLKEYIPKNYSWLYSTTYWNNTVFETSEQSGQNTSSLPNRNEKYFVFVASQGKLCGAGFAYCAPATTLGCGIRPVVTIQDELAYLIRTKTDGNGSIEVVENALGNEEIKFKVNSNKDYKLKTLTIKTDSGESIEFTDGEIIDNEDGTKSIDKSKFTMPFENITIEANFQSGTIVDVPNTFINLANSKGIKIIAIIFLINAIAIMFYKQKIKNN